MTVQEAIDWLKAINATQKDSIHKNSLLQRKESIHMAIEALEKQIPKKVIFEDDGEVLLCPNCNIDLMGSLTDPDHDPYYCFECGQALKWGE